MGNRETIIQALETLGGAGYFPDIEKATGISKEVLGRTLRRMYHSGYIDRDYVDKIMDCHLSHSGTSIKKTFLYKIKK